jgi:hypothetical protein
MHYYFASDASGIEAAMHAAGLTTISPPVANATYTINTGLAQTVKDAMASYSNCAYCGVYYSGSIVINKKTGSSYYMAVYTVS